MAHSPKPWFREDRQAWFVTVNGKRHHLGLDEKEAKRKFRELMAAPEPKPTSAQPGAAFSVAEIFEKFLDWSQKHREPTTYEWLQYRIQMFINVLGGSVHMTVETVACR